MPVKSTVPVSECIIQSKGSMWWQGEIITAHTHTHTCGRMRMKRTQKNERRKKRPESMRERGVTEVVCSPLCLHDQTHGSLFQVKDQRGVPVFSAEDKQNTQTPQRQRIDH